MSHKLNSLVTKLLEQEAERFNRNPFRTPTQRQQQNKQRLTEKSPQKSDQK